MTNKEKFIKWFIGELGSGCDCVRCRVLDLKGSMANQSAYPDTFRSISTARPNAVKQAVEAKLVEFGLEYTGLPNMPEITLDSYCFTPETFWSAIHKRKRAAK